MERGAYASPSILLRLVIFCLYKDAPYAILDEPTAALDPVAEADIYQRMNQFIEGKGAIYISHRLSSCHFLMLHSHLVVVQRCRSLGRQWRKISDSLHNDTHEYLFRLTGLCLPAGHKGGKVV